MLEAHEPHLKNNLSLRRKERNQGHFSAAGFPSCRPRQGWWERGTCSCLDPQERKKENLSEPTEWLHKDIQYPTGSPGQRSEEAQIA